MPRVVVHPLRQQAVDEAVDDGAHLAAGSLWIVGAGDVERGLVEGADEGVGERVDGLSGDRPPPPSPRRSTAVTRPRP